MDGHAKIILGGRGEPSHLVDQHNIIGLGEDVPVSTANLNGGLVALRDGKMITLKVPHPTGFYTTGLDGASTAQTPAGKGAARGQSSGVHRGTLLPAAVRTDPGVRC